MKRPGNKRWPWLAAAALLAALALLALPGLALAQDTGVGPVATTTSPPTTMIGWLAAAALIPLVLILTTCFIKMSVVLGCLRNALGLQQILGQAHISAIAVLLSALVMAPVGLQIGRTLQPTLNAPDTAQTQPLLTAADAWKPMERWLTRHNGAQERAFFVSLSSRLHQQAGLDPEDNPGQDALTLVCGFVLTELKEAFIIGFILFVPFLVVDLVVANILLSLGLHTTPPLSISLPLKLLLFILIDGWTLIIQGLVLGYL